MSLPIAPESNRMRVASVAAINKAARPFGAMLAAAGVGVALATSLQIAVEVVAGVAMTPLMVLVEGAPLGLFLFAFPLLWSATASPVGGLAILVIATCLLSTIVKRPGGFAKVTLLDWAVVALFASYGLSTLSASAPFDSHELGRLGEDFALYLVARSTATRVVPLARSLAALVAGSVVAALITGLAYFNGEARYLENIARLAESGIGINNFASILLAGCCLAAGLLGYSRRLVIRSLLVMASGIILLAVVLSQSRGALVGLTAAGVTALLISWR
ncbi:MAG TPA: hypothetical protein VG015_05315, partial [Candidatus Dormibacteraeota bacterium]|nr:hypothetical protein [Candidatus Dormibacteraeota bacterium]